MKLREATGVVLAVGLVMGASGFVSGARADEPQRQLEEVKKELERVTKENASLKAQVQGLERAVMELQAERDKQRGERQLPQSGQGGRATDAANSGGPLAVMSHLAPGETFVSFPDGTSLVIKHSDQKQFKEMLNAIVALAKAKTENRPK